MRLLGAIEDLSLAPPRKQSAAPPSTPAAQTAAQTATQTATEIAALVELYAPLLFRIAHSVLRSPTDAEDVVQDTFVRVLEHRARLPEIRDLRVWLIRIAWNLALDRKRRIRPDQMDRSVSDTLPAVAISADRQLAHRTQMYSVFHEIDRLPKKERAVLLLSALDELSTPELAAVLGKSESAVRALLFRARTRLRQRLEKGSSR